MGIATSSLSRAWFSQNGRLIPDASRDADSSQSLTRVRRRAFIVRSQSFDPRVMARASSESCIWASHIPDDWIPDTYGAFEDNRS